ncbi:MAG: cell division protein FtsL [Burkholderiaceae bacterium]|jgi:cell division protein FtsL|nr:cell division protein FtsL [Burkholderiaceae bacterium]MBP7661529.1 cell division protein FtsL [Burkholderiaceae bacterium]
MTRVNLLLGALLILCALGLVTSQQRARRLFVDLERAQAKAQQLEVQWDQLQLDQTGLAKASLIDSRARKGLAMQPLSADKTLHLTIDTAALARAQEAAR